CLSSYGSVRFFSGCSSAQNVSWYPSDWLIKNLDVNNSGVVWMVYADARLPSRSLPDQPYFRKRSAAFFEAAGIQIKD
ncbi:MAG TPA: hypothetical protein VJY36_06590, partial [Candidatus Bathyarchaeia archaeon]|nr:hypothetical protein [Candidatus Bathyarchaeia archaeon]